MQSQENQVNTKVSGNKAIEYGLKAARHAPQLSKR